MSGTHSNISVFVPHLGCPHRCSFCNQKHITMQSKEATEDDVIQAVNIAVNSKNYNPENTEIAFFGGSFTAIDREYMLRLLNAAYKFVLSGTVSGIRVSTRPDAIDEQILDILASHGVKTVELGAQSMFDSVLELNERGHTAECVAYASTLIKPRGIKLGLQMMTGLYGSNDELDFKTAVKIAELKPDFVRIYPTVTLKDTRLADYFAKGKYIPPTLSESVNLSRKLCDFFESKNIPVIRLGLHTIDADSYVAGPWHPAYKELCDSLNFKEKIADGIIKTGNSKGTYEVFVNPKDVSKAVGQSKSNILYFERIGYNIKIKQSADINSNQVIVKRV